MKKKEFLMQENQSFIINSYTEESKCFETVAYETFCCSF